jgi:glucose-6-phosphate 1-dehydrogenase
MKFNILLNYDDDTRQVEEEEKGKFIKDILTQIGLPVEEFWTSDKPLTVRERIKLREILTAYNIVIIDDLDGHMQMYVDNDLVAEWKKCTYVLKKDLRQVDPRKKLYMEMTVENWSVFEELDSEAVSE